MDVQATFQLAVPDYRKATYYGMVQRNRKAMRIAMFVLLATLSYLLYTVLSGGQVQYLIIFAAGGYLIWILLQFARQERGINAYLKSGNTVLGKEFEISFDKKHMRVRLPEKKVDNTFELKKLAVVFELSELFIIYPNLQDAYLLPKRALSEEDIRQLRERFYNSLGDKFESRFLKRK